MASKFKGIKKRKIIQIFSTDPYTKKKKEEESINQYISSGTYDNRPVSQISPDGGGSKRHRLQPVRRNLLPKRTIKRIRIANTLSTNTTSFCGVYKALDNQYVLSSRQSYSLHSKFQYIYF